MEFEDLLREVGDFGRYQRSLILWFLVPSTFLLPWYQSNILFMASVPDYWCAVPELDTTNLSLAERHLLTRPLTVDGGRSNCEMFDVNYTVVLSSLPDNWTSTIGDLQKAWRTRHCDLGWQYDTTDLDSTVLTKWNLFCGKKYLNSLTLSTNGFGSVIGTPIFGSLSDRIGRRPTFFILVLCSALSGTASVLVPNFIAFFVLRVMNGTLLTSIFQISYIILVELVGPSKRTRMNGITNCSWTFGFCALPLVAYLSHRWMTFGLVTTSVTFLLFGYWRFLPESPRWLISQGRYMEASTILFDISKKNGKSEHTREDLFQKTQKLGQVMRQRSPIESSRTRLKAFFKLPNLRKKFFIVTFLWVAEMVTYFGLYVNITNLAGNQFLNFFLISVVELPGLFCCWLLMQKIGRRLCNCFFFFLAGFSCILPSLLPPGFRLLGVIVSLVGKFGAVATFMCIYQQAAELFPTPVRSIGMGVTQTIATVISITTPFIINTADYGKAIPFAIMGSLCILAAIASFFLPETLHAVLPQTIMDGENFGKDQKLFPCLKDSGGKKGRDQESGNKTEDNLETLSPEKLMTRDVCKIKCESSEI